MQKPVKIPVVRTLEIFQFPKVSKNWWVRFIVYG